MSHLQPLTGQTVLVTGASGGIGAAIVERLSAEGARPVIHYGRDRQRAEALLHQLGGNGLIVQADLSSPAIFRGNRNASTSSRRPLRSRDGSMCWSTMPASTGAEISCRYRTRIGA